MKKISIIFSLILIITNCTKNKVEDADEMGLGGNKVDSMEYEHMPMVSDSDIIFLEQRKDSVFNVISANGDVLVGDFPPVRNQGSEGSCTAFSIGYCVASYYEHIYRNVPYTDGYALRSPEFIYNNTKFAGSCSSAGSNGPTVMNFLIKTGSCNWAAMPYSSSNGCSNKQSEFCKPHSDVGGFSAFSRVNKTVADVNTILGYGFPVIMCYIVYDNTQIEMLNSPYIVKSTTGKYLGRHCVAIVGYNKSLNCFIAQNSWGTTRGNKGYFYISFVQFPKIAEELYWAKPNLPKDFNVKNRLSPGGPVDIRIDGVVYNLPTANYVKTYHKYYTNDVYVYETYTGKGVWDGPYKLNQGVNYMVRQSPTGNQGDYVIVEE